MKRYNPSVWVEDKATLESDLSAIQAAKQQGRESFLCPFLFTLLVAQKAINSINRFKSVCATGIISLNRLSIEVVAIFSPGMIIGGANGGF
ncbi:hypothetical protein ACFLUA_04020 [Chloroflexota bacterium]